jgi:diguanylate cyclase (GGDEF)-like protein
VVNYSITHVLLVDDRLESQRWIEDLLHSAEIPFDLIQAASVDDAIELIALRRVDILLADSRLLSCSSLCFRGLPVIVLGEEDDHDAPRALAAGAQDYLAKSTLTPPLLARAIRYAIERHGMLRQLERLSLMDELTGLYNRRGFFMLGEQQIEIARRTKLPLSLIYLDVDGLKRVNDTFGHAAGDRLLADTGDALAATFRSADIVARIGGDEFAILAQVPRGSADRPELRLLQRIDARNDQRPDLPPIRSSIGIETAEPQDRRGLRELLAAADARMYARRRERCIASEPAIRSLDSRLSTLD